MSQGLVCADDGRPGKTKNGQIFGRTTRISSSQLQTILWDIRLYFLVLLSLNSKSGKTEKRGNASYVNKEIQQKRTKNQERLTRIIPLQGKKSGKSGNKLLLNTGSMPVDTISRARKFQPRVSPWVERLGDTTSRTLSLMPRGAVAVAC